MHSAIHRDRDFFIRDRGRRCDEDANPRSIAVHALRCAASVTILRLTLGLVAIAARTLGPGAWSLDRALGIDDTLSGWTGLLIAVIAGVGGAAALLAASWRPPSTTNT